MSRTDHVGDIGHVDCPDDDETHGLLVKYLGMQGGYPFVKVLTTGEEFVWDPKDIKWSGDDGVTWP